MRKKKKYLVFFSPKKLPDHSPSSIQAVNWANAASNLDYSTILVYVENQIKSINPLKFILSNRIMPISKSLAKFYQVSNKLLIINIPNPWPIDRLFTKHLSSAVILEKYFLPKWIFPKTKLFYTHDLNYARLAIKNLIPCIWEWDFPVKQNFENKFAYSQFLKLVVANTNETKKNLIKHGIPYKKIISIHNGINSAFFKKDIEKIKNIRDNLINERRYLCVYSGALLEFKGIDLVLAVAKKLPDCQFILAGGNKAQIKHYDEVKTKEGIQNVKFLGSLPHEELIPILHSADILLNPHLKRADDKFTSPLKFFEYLATGNPIVSTKIAALNEFYQKKLAINWCKPDCVSSFAKCIEQTLKKYPRKEKGYIQNIQFAKQFTWEKRIEKILSFVDEKYRPRKYD